MKKWKLSPPSPDMIRFMKVIAVIGQLPSLLQIIKTLARQSAGDLSLPGLAVALFCAISWLVYSMMLRDKPLILSNVLGCFLNGANLVVTLIFR